MFRFALEVETSKNPNPFPLEPGRDYDRELDNIISVMADICASLQESGRLTFVVEGFGPKPWPVDVYTDLAIFLEELPGLVEWMATQSNATCRVGFYEQGIQRWLNFENREDGVQVTCESFGSFDPDPRIEVVSRESLSSMITELIACFLQEAIQIAPDIVAHEWFQEWRRSVQ